MPKGHSAPRLSGWPATPASEIGCSPTQRAFTAQPAVQSVQFVNLTRISQRAGRGMPGQFSLHRAVSVISRHGAGVSSAPTAAPLAILMRSLRVVMMSASLMAIQTAMFQTFLPVTAHAGIHAHGAARVAADGVDVICRERVAGADAAMA